MTKYLRETFDGKIINSDDMTHQHVSNSYWFDRIHNCKSDEHKDIVHILEHINEKFDGLMLPYRPLKRFYGEIAALFVNKHLQYLCNQHYEIIFEGESVGWIDLDKEDEE